MKGENERLQKDLQKVQQEVTNGSTRNETSRSSDMTLEKRVSATSLCWTYSSPLLISPPFLKENVAIEESWLS